MNLNGHQSTFLKTTYLSEVPPCGFPVDWITTSPCKRRPDSGEPCPLAWREKNNSVCHACHFIGNDAPIQYHAAQIARMLDRNEIIFQSKPGIDALLQRPESGVRRSGMDGLCVMDYCRRPVQKITHVGDFCGERCYERAYNRLRRWLQSNPNTPPPEHVLYFPMEGSKVRPKRQAAPVNAACQLSGCPEPAVTRHNRGGWMLCYPHAKLVTRRYSDAARREIEATEEWLLRKVGYKAKSKHRP